jgi:arylsulfatase A-like enzyme
VKINPSNGLRFLAALALSALPLIAADPAHRPNILIILADDLGYGEMSCQGNPQVPTPNVDSLAKSGIRFTSGYVSGPYCSPTRAGLMTGRYQQRFGHEFNPGPVQGPGPAVGLSLKEKTIGDRFKEIGYATAWIGKSHLGYLPEFHPLKRGFDEYFGFLGGAHDYLNAAADGRNPIFRGTNRIDQIDYTTDAFGREAVAFIEKNRQQPWLMYLAFNAVHGPLEATPKYLARFSQIDEKKRQTFAAMLSALDDAVGSVLAKLREHNLEENTLIFFISDNGGPTRQTTSGNGPLRGYKAQTWEGGIRVPWIVQWKGHLPAGKVDDRPVIQLDVLPTALAASGVKAKPEWNLDGVDLLPYLRGENTGLPHEVLYWRMGPQMALRMGDWKIVKARGDDEPLRKGTATTEGAHLYNLKNDISEKQDLASSNAGRFKELCAAWEKLDKQMVEATWTPGARNPEKKAAKRARKKAE